MRRVIAFTLLGYLLMTLFGPLQHAFGLELVTVDVALIIVLHVAMVDPRGGVFRPASRFGAHGGGLLDASGVATALLLGYVCDVLGSGLKGVHSLALGLVFLGARGVARQVYMAGVVSQILVTLVASVVASIFALLVRWAVGVAPGIGMIVVVLAQALLTAAVAPILMRLLRFLDARLWPDKGGERGSLRQLGQ